MFKIDVKYKKTKSRVRFPVNGRGHTANEGEAELVEEMTDQNSVLTQWAKRSHF